MCNASSDGYSYGGRNRHACSCPYVGANQHPCTNGVGHIHAGTDSYPDAEPHTNLYTNTDADGDAYTRPYANLPSRTEPNTGRDPRHRLLPCQRDRG